MEVSEFLERSASGSIDLEEFAADAVEKAEAIQKKYAPFITINKNPKLESGSGALLGLPISVKDCICTAGHQDHRGF